MGKIQVLLDCNEHLDGAAAEIGKTSKKRNADGSIPLPTGRVTMIGVVPDGARDEVSGRQKPSVMIEVTRADGTRVFAQCTMTSLLTAAAAFHAKWPETLNRPGAFAIVDDRMTLVAVPDGHVPVIGSVPAESIDAAVRTAADSICSCAPQADRIAFPVHDNGDGVTRCSRCNKPARPMPN